MNVCGESGDVQGETVSSWMERLPEILQGDAKENIYNLDETGSSWRALPDHGFGEKGKQCKRGKRSMERITVALITNAAGGKEKAIVIEKSENPAALKILTRQAFWFNTLAKEKLG